MAPVATQTRSTISPTTLIVTLLTGLVVAGATVLANAARADVAEVRTTIAKRADDDIRAAYERGEIKGRLDAMQSSIDTISHKIDVVLEQKNVR